MAWPPLSVAPLEALCTALAAAGLPAAQDPADVNPPGAWVNLEGITTAVALDGTHQLRAAVWLVVPDTDHHRALEALAAAYSQLLTVLTPDGEVTTEGLVLPDNPTPLPALRVPVNLT